MDLRIKQKALNDHLPADSALRIYLAQKDETAKVARPRPEPRLARLAAIPNVKTLLAMPPMCLYEGAVKRVVPPLGLCYIAAAMEREGLDVTILDCIVEGMDE